MTKGRFRWKAVLLLVGSFAIIAVGWFLLHKYQMTSMHGRFLEQATRAEENGHYDRAVKFLQKYLVVKQDDLDAQARYAVLLEDKMAPSRYTHQNALTIYEQVLKQDEKRSDIRKRAAKLNKEFENLDPALEHLRVLQNENPNEPEFEILQGKYKLFKILKEMNVKIQKGNLNDSDKKILKGKLNEVNVHYENAIKKSEQPNPTEKNARLFQLEMQAYEGLAQILKIGLKNPDEAEKKLKEFIDENPQESLAYLLRAKIRQQGSKVIYENPAALDENFSGAEEDLAQARKLAPRNVAVLLASADQEYLLANEEIRLAKEKGKQKSVAELVPYFDRARVFLRAALEQQPENITILAKLADVEKNAQRPKEARDYLQTAQTKATGKNRNDLLRTLATLLIEDPAFQTDSKINGTTEVIKQLRDNGEPEKKVKFLEAKIAIQEGKWSKAVDLLEDIRPLLLEDPEQVIEADLLLGFCFGQLNNLDQQLAVYQRARKLDPLRSEPRFRIINALGAMDGRLDEAIVECKSLRELPLLGQSKSNADILYARLLIKKNSSLPSSVKLNWEEVTKVLQEHAKKNPKSIENVMLQAEVSIAKEKSFTEARKILEEAKKLAPATDKFPTDMQFLDPWIALAYLEVKEGKLPRGLEILDEAKTQFGDLPPLRQAKLRFMPLDKKEALAFLRPLSENLDKFPPQYQADLLAALANSYQYVASLKNPKEPREGNSELLEAEKYLKKLAILRPNQLKVQFALFELYLRMGNVKQADATLKPISDIEGKDGPLTNYSRALLWIYRAEDVHYQEVVKELIDLYPLLRAVLYLENDKMVSADELLKEKRADLEAAEKSLLAARAKRPHWPLIPETMWEVAKMGGKSKDEMDKKSELVLEHLREAVAMGSRRMDVIRELDKGLREIHQYAEAEEVIGKLQEAAPQSKELKRMAAEVSFFNEKNEKALENALTAIDSGSNNFEDHLWKGRMLIALDKQPKEAEASLQKAILLAKTEPAPYVFLVQLQIRNKEIENAKATIEEMKKKVPAEKLPFALADCYLAINDKVSAEKVLQEALAAQPDDPAILEGMIKFQMSNGPMDKTEPYLQRLLDFKQTPEKYLPWARRTLALAIGFQKDIEKQKRAMMLIENNLVANPSSVDDQIVRGALLTARSEGRQEGIKILEKAFQVKKPTSRQLFFLADLYEKEGDWRKDRAAMVQLVSSQSKNETNPIYLAIFINKLLLHDEMNEAEVWLPQLTDRIKKYLESKDSDPTNLAQRFAECSRLLSDIARKNPRLIAEVLSTEPLLRATAAKTGIKESMLVVADFLGNCHQLDKSLKICEQLAKDLPPLKVVAAALGSIANTQATPKQMERVEALVNLGRQQKPDFVMWDAFAAILKERQANYSDAEVFYRKVLKSDPKNLVALNNLAFLLGLQGKGDEALSLIHKALDTLDKGGPDGDILDSRAVILRNQGKLGPAEMDLQEAIRQGKSASKVFHLAQVYQSIDEKKTIQLFEEAKRFGLDEDMLHPLEREGYRQIAAMAEKAKKKGS